MKKLILLFVFYVCIIYKGNSQFSIEDGPLMDKGENGKITKMIGGDKDQYCVLRENGKGKGQKYFVEKYNCIDYKQLYSTQLPVVQNAQNVETYFVNGSCVFFYCIEDEKNTSSLFCCMINPEGTASAPIKLITSENKHGERNVVVLPSYYFSINISQDQSYISVVSRSFENKGKDLKSKVSVYKSIGMEKAWEADLSSLDASDFFIDDDGNFMCIAFENNSYKKDLVVISKLDRKVNKVPLSLGVNQSIEGVRIVKNGNKIGVGGFFKDAGSKSEGVFLFLINSISFEKLSSNQQYLSENLMKDLFSGKNDFEEKYLIVSSVEVMGDDFYFIGKDVEKDIVIKQRTTYSTRYGSSLVSASDGGKIVNTTTTEKKTSTNQYGLYKSNQIVFFKTSSSGNIDWVKNLPSKSEVPAATISVLVSSNISLRPEIINFVLEDKLLFIHGDMKFFGFGVKTTNVQYSIVSRNGDISSGKLCDDLEKNCFVYNSLGLYGYFNIYHCYGKKVVAYFNKKENQHFGTITFN